MFAEALGRKLFEGCQKNQTEKALSLIDQGAKVDIEDHQQWSPLIWSATHGNVQVARALIERGAAEMYREIAPTNSADLGGTQVISQDEEGGGAGAGGHRLSNAPAGAESGFTAKRKRHTPMHWAAFKGHTRVLWLLLAPGLGLSVHARDQLGNTVLHQAAAGGDVESVKVLLSQGVDVMAKNDRGHSALALATASDVKEVLRRAMSATECESTKIQFSYKVQRYMCSWTESFFCREAVIKLQVYADVDSDRKEKPLTLSTERRTELAEAEHQLEMALKINQSEAIKKALANAEGKPVDVKLLKRCRDQEARMETGRGLRTAMQTGPLHEVDSFFDRMASLDLAIKKAQEASAEQVLLDQAMALRRRLHADMDLTRAIVKALGSEFHEIPLPEEVEGEGKEGTEEEKKGDGEGAQTEGPLAKLVPSFQFTDAYLKTLKEFNIKAKAEAAASEGGGDERLLKRAERLVNTLQCLKDISVRLEEVAPCADVSLEDLLRMNEQTRQEKKLPPWHEKTEEFEQHLTQYRDLVEAAASYDVPRQLLEDAKVQIGILETQLVEMKRLEEENRLKAERKKKGRGKKGN
uniref:Uncharacterized protein n=1 Tax=Chromera velia CCMP2878 TaxID=1169474 RepID=A0A0G4HQL9_9ALVE|eukprot:Cvel_30290.t1-p1 / transcript=Cvel_30290.t1 / gene=Cvel_30290 / organism=Chromera_velia_CCMP2878 / gene_product=Kinase D-interacting substrate of 220 kDa, putative / transcript_product=Kinase D-interacting substrate of 220 kDa, putative / location=Cvel_scaffold4295:2982-10325(-) / protein_length=580 / sequence_SO=supercontig / SO=protein_coding / is_pseudo=false